MLKKLRTNWLSFALALVVIISLLISGLVWTNPFQYEGARRDNLIHSNQQFTTQSMGDVYLPTSLVQTNRRGNQAILYNPQVNLIRKLKVNIHSWQFGRVSTVKSNNSDVYLSYLRRRNSLMMSYPDGVPTVVFNETFSQSINSDQINQINHIVIPLGGPREIYLLSDHHYGVYRLRLSKGNFNKVQNIAKDANRIPVDHKIVNEQTVMTYPRGFSLPTFAFQVTNQNIDTLSTNLMSSNQHANITTSHNGNNVVYSNGTNRRMTFNQDRGTVNYKAFLNNDDKRTNEQLYSYFYNRLVKTGVQLSNIRFDGVNDHQRQLTYRSYVDDFPIFNNDGYGTIKLRLTRGGTEHCQMSIYSVQVPLPIDQQEVRLPSSTVVFDQLHASLHFREVKGLRVGYLWKTDNKNKKVVKLTPSYFVKYHGNWINYTELIK